MKVGDLVIYNYRIANKDKQQLLGVITKIDGNAVWWTDTGGNASCTHIVNLEAYNESR